ncbi:protein mono-ADP-ribosyltransferase PARP4 isoform X3 [Salarias fasciatus]|uniref:protein mono-ADP-ribosyltransferase PARP4 isoform X3 n=1 Tax=Salarias fasciatus TaxID=181472 RepID=UPI00117696D7|nr:protein mono-ADP-ribosyltransferase PARP4 isoform X3 [Salarias fasciatus]
MAVFENTSVLFALRNVSFKEKEKLKSAVTENGGSVCFVINKECSLVVTDAVEALSPGRRKNIQKYQTPVVRPDYVSSCLERGALLPLDDFRLDPTSPEAAPPPSTFTPKRAKKQPSSTLGQRLADSVTLTAEKSDSINKDHPTFPDDFQVAKYSILEQIDGTAWCVLELQSCRGEAGQRYRVVTYQKDDAKAKSAITMERFLSTSEEALSVYQALEDLLKGGFKKSSSLPEEVQDLGSAALQQLLVEEKLQTASISQKEVAVFVELLWAEALGNLNSVLAVSVEKLSLSDVCRAEGLLLQARKKLQENKNEEVASLLEEFYSLLPHKAPRTSDADLSLISEKLDLCQLIRDILNASEMTLRSPAPSCVGKYRALRCSIDLVQPGTSEYQLVGNHLQSKKIQILQILRVCRPVELQTFKRELGTIHTLLHSSDPKNFVGILSRGLMLPRVLEEVHGVQRRDAGELGSGIYFTDYVKSALFYSKPSQTDGSRLLLVCDVALGNMKFTMKRDPSLTKAPEGYHSMVGTRAPRAPHLSDFQFAQFVVYSPDQVQLKYVIKLTDSQSELKDFAPAVDMLAEPCRPLRDPGLSADDKGLDDIGTPLKDVKAGLLDGSGQQLPLQAVHVKCRLMDLLSQVTIFQKYTNQSSVPIEAKYVFPLDDSAAVCGFEAFINGKHLVGQVKEKEAARKEYRDAVSRGHGAYLMDQDAPDVFTISVGNLPPGATVLIKVTFVSELIVKDSSVLFSLPGSLAPWQQSAALNQTTQVSVDKVCITDQSASSREFTLDMSVDMPFEISSLQCLTHKIKMKRTACKAVLSVLPGAVLGPEGFQLSITLSEVHLPRMWVEKHPDKDSQACMLVFYPSFEVGSSTKEVIVLLDASESMKGESLTMARRIALQVLKNLDVTDRLNIVLFGTDHKEAFLTAKPIADVAVEAENFIKHASSVGGSTELWRPLRALSLLPPSSGIRNLLLLSDGHIQNADATLQLLRDGVQHSRLFTCGLSSTANRHMLRALAQAGGGAYEFFDKKTKHNWVEKVKRQVKRMASPSCTSVSVKWQQFDLDADAPLQAPKQLHALFNDCHALVYGLVPHCTQATLLGNLSGQELETMVSTSDLQKTTGTFLHKLTARALIRDYEDGNLGADQGQHESCKAELRSFIVNLSKEFSVLSQFTSFVAIEDRDSDRAEDAFTDVPKLLAEEDVDFLPYIDWNAPPQEKHPASSAPSEDDLFSLIMETSEALGISEETISPEPQGVPRRLKALCRRSAIERLDSPESPQYSPTGALSAWKVSHLVSMGTVQDATSQKRSDSDSSEDSVSSEMGATHVRKYCKAVSHLVSMETEQDATSQKRSDSDTSEDSVWSEMSRSPKDFSSLQQEAEANSADRFEIFKKASFHERRMEEQTTPKKKSQERKPQEEYGAPLRDTVLSYAQVAEARAEAQLDLARHPPPPAPPPSGSLLAFGRGAQRGVSLFSSSSSPAAAQGHPPPPPPKAASLSSFSLPGPSVQLSPFGGLSPPPRRGSGVDFSFGASAPPAARGPSPLFGHPLPPPPPPPASLSSFSLPGPSVRHSLFGVPSPSPRRGSGLGFSFGASAPPAARGPSPLFGHPPPPPPGSGQGFSFGAPALTAARGPSPLFGHPPPPPPGSGQGFSFGVPALTAARGPPPPPPESGLAPPPPLRQSGQGFSFGFGASADTSVPLCEDMMELAASAERLASSSVTFSFGDSPFGSAVDEESVRVAKGLGSDQWLRATEPILTYGASCRAPGRLICQGMPRRRSALGLRSRHQTHEENMKLKWRKIFKMQHSDGYWEFSSELEELINFRGKYFTDEFLMKKGLLSLGGKAHADVLRLLATLLVLQLMRVEKLDEGKLLRTLFSLEDSTDRRPEFWEAVRKAVDWVCWADRQYPSIYSRLEFGLSWEASTRQLLGYDRMPTFSLLQHLDLQRTPVPSVR